MITASIFLIDLTAFVLCLTFFFLPHAFRRFSSRLYGNRAVSFSFHRVALDCLEVEHENVIIATLSESSRGGRRFN